MATLEYLCRMAGVNPASLSKEENWLIEAALLNALCEELTQIYTTKISLHTIKNYHEKENMMITSNVIPLILQDLIQSNDYTINGVATYSNVPEEVIYDIAIGNNNNPSLEVSRKIIELHRTARADLYHRVMQKITAGYVAEKPRGTA